MRPTEASLVFFVVWVIVLLLTVPFSVIFNFRWKDESFDSSRYCGAGLRILIGLDFWVFLLALPFDIANFTNGDMAHSPPLSIFGLVFGLILLLIPFIRSKKDGYPAILISLYAIIASMGSYTNIFLTLTLIGLPFKRLLQDSYDSIPLPRITRKKEKVSVVDKDGNMRELDDYSVSDGTSKKIIR